MNVVQNFDITIHAGYLYRYVESESRGDISQIILILPWLGRPNLVR